MCTTTRQSRQRCASVDATPLALDKLGVHAVSACFTGWERVPKDVCLAKICLKWHASSADLAFQDKCTPTEAAGLLFGTQY